MGRASEKPDVRELVAHKTPSFLRAFFNERMSMENWIRGKSAIVIGERDGVQGPSIAKCVEAAGGKVVYAVTECFV